MSRFYTITPPFQFSEEKGISATETWRKAQLLDDPRQTSLLMFLQGMSLKDGGLRQVARDLITMFPERFGTETLRAMAVNKSQLCPVRAINKVGGELSDDEYFVNGSKVNIDWVFERLGFSTFTPCDDRRTSLDPYIYRYEEENETPRRILSYADWAAKREAELDARHPERTGHTVAQLFEVCQQLAEWDLPGFIWQLCTNLHWLVNGPGAAPKSGSDMDTVYTRRVKVASAGERDHGFYSPSLPYFQDIVSALFEYQKKCIERAQASLVLTSIARQVFATLDKALNSPTACKMVLVEGRSRIGKSTALAAWEACHLDRVRMISLSSYPARRSFFHQLARALGIHTQPFFSADRVQYIIESFLRESRMMILFDEGHYLWPQRTQISGRPELIDWVDTALCNHGLPVGIAATQQFIHRKKAVETQTGWTSEQFAGRLLAYKKLPEAPTREDVEAVASKLLPGLDKASWLMVCGYCLSTPTPLHVLSLTAGIIQLEQTRLGGAISFEQVKAIISERMGEDSAMAREFAQPAPATPRRRTAPALNAHTAPSADPESQEITPAGELQVDGKRQATGLQPSCTASANDLEDTASELATAPDRRQVPSMDNSRAKGPLLGSRRGLAPKEAPGAQRQAKPAMA